MPRSRTIFAVLIAAGWSTLGLAAERRDEFDPWRNQPPRPARAQGPIGLPAPRQFAPVADAQPASATLSAPKQEIVDAAIQSASYQPPARPAVTTPGLRQESPATAAIAPQNFRHLFEQPSRSTVAKQPVGIVSAAPTPAPANAMLAISAPAAPRTAPQTTTTAKPTTLAPTVAAPLPQPPAHVDHNATPAVASLPQAEPMPLETAAERSRRVFNRRPASAAKSASPASHLPSLANFSWANVSSKSLATGGAALAIVLGLLLLVMWVLRKAAPRANRPLPEDVVSVIGRAPLANRQVAQLIKIGGKLVLVCVTPEGVKPITEITDPEEVASVLGLCEQGKSHSASAAFRDVFEQLTREPAGPGFLGDETPLVDRQKLADAYANTPGGRAYA